MKEVTNPLRLWFPMPVNVLMVLAVMEKDDNGRHLDVEIAVYRKDFDAGKIVSRHVKEADFGEYRVRVIFPEKCFIETEDEKIVSAGCGIENIKGLKAFLLPQTKSSQRTLVVLENDNIHTPIDESFERSVSRLLGGLSLVFTP